MTDRQISEILSDIVIIVDTREQKNQHIIKYLEENKIKYILKKLDSGDYSLMLPNYDSLGLNEKFLVERKNSLDELAVNFTSGRERFTNEFKRLVKGQKIHLLVENATFKKLFNGTYRSKLPPKSYLASLLTWNIRYKCPVWFTTPTETPTMIYYILYYELYNYLKELP